MAAMAALPASSALDLSRLPAFQLVEVDYEAERSTLLARVQAALADIGVDFDPAQEADPIVILAEEVAYGRFLALQAINDAGKRMTVAFGYDEALDHLAATFYADLGIRRLDGETNDRFRRRILLAANARSPGALRGYEYWALTFGPALSDAKALNHESGLIAPGAVAIILLGDPGAPGALAEAAQVQAVLSGLMDPAVKLGSDQLIIRAASRTPAAIEAVLEIPAGPDATAIVAAAQQSLAKFLAERIRIGARVPVSGLHAALSVAGVTRVRLVQPVGDIVTTADGVVQITAVSISAEVVDD